MLQLCRCLDLSQEAIGPQRCSKIRMKNLDGYVTLVAEIVGEVNGGHATRSDFTVEAVLGVQRVGQPGEDVGHQGCGIMGSDMMHRKQNPGSTI
jgi:hypothetical protein